jgi:small conductance mechanosensitive channel
MKGGRNMDLEVILQRIWELITIYGIKVLAAIVIFIVGRWIAKGFRKLVRNVMGRRNVDQTITGFVGNLTYVLLLTFFVVAALGQLGIQTTSFIAILGAAGLAIGLALQGSLANFAAGFLMIIFRPFKVGDLIEGAGATGTVEEIQIFTTMLKTPDNKMVIVPNSKMTADNIVNYTAKGTRRVDMVVGIGYESDIDKAREIMEELAAKDDRVLKDPAPTVAVVELADNSVNFVFRPWVNASDYWSVWFDLTEKVKKRFDEAGISIPYPQRDIHVYQHTE